MKVTFFKIVLLASLVYFFSWFTVYKLGINKLSIQSEDTIPAMFIPVTLIKDQTLYADKYYQMIRSQYPNPDDKTFAKDLTPFYFRKVMQEEKVENQVVRVTHYVSAFPIITGLLAIPVYFVPVILGMPITFENLTVLAHVTSALITALSGGFLYLLLTKHFVADKKKALLLTAVYLFGTINYALISQAPWQHGTMQLFIILGLYFLFNTFAKLQNGDHKIFKEALFSGLCLGFAVLARPTAALYLMFLFVLIYIRYAGVLTKLEQIKAFGIYILTLLTALLFFIWYNGTFYLSIANQGYYDQLARSWLSKFPEGFLGVWFSPSKGILVYSPVFIFSLVGLFIVLRRKQYKKDLEYLLFGLIVLLHTLIVGKWKQWYGGWSYGYRMSADVIPFLILLLVPYINSPLYEKTKKLFYGLFAFSLFMQLLGIAFFDGIWHAAYDKGFTNTSWLWSIKDSEFVFNIRRILVKLGLLAQACPKCLP